MKLLDGDDYGVVRDEKHLVVETESPRVVFSFTRKGDAISIHFASDKDGLRGVRCKLEEFCCWAFEAMPWCQMILGNIKRRSVERVAMKCGFRYVATIDDMRVYVRARTWAA